ncbi:non-specific serine/threonine protein kinase [Trifolium repens]|nr:non-specific serine/threonine protein kinase [Trifolium repens]
MDTGKARKGSDIFSFRVVLLEIACGKKAIHYQELKGEVSLVEWVWELYGLRNIIAAADPKLYGQFDVKELERPLPSPIINEQFLSVPSFFGATG